MYGEIVLAFERIGVAAWLGTGILKGARSRVGHSSITRTSMIEERRPWLLQSGITHFRCQSLEFSPKNPIVDWKRGDGYGDRNHYPWSSRSRARMGAHSFEDRAAFGSRRSRIINRRDGGWSPDVSGGDLNHGFRGGPALPRRNRGLAFQRSASSGRRQQGGCRGSWWWDHDGFPCGYGRYCPWRLRADWHCVNDTAGGSRNYV